MLAQVSISHIPWAISFSFRLHPHWSVNSSSPLDFYPPIKINKIQTLTTWKNPSPLHPVASPETRPHKRLHTPDLKIQYQHRRQIRASCSQKMKTKKMKKKGEKGPSLIMKELGRAASGACRARPWAAGRGSTPGADRARVRRSFHPRARSAQCVTPVGAQRQASLRLAQPRIDRAPPGETRTRSASFAAPSDRFAIARWGEFRGEAIFVCLIVWVWRVMGLVGSQCGVVRWAGLSGWNGGFRGYCGGYWLN